MLHCERCERGRLYPTAKPSLLPIVPCIPWRAGRESLARYRLYFVGYETAVTQRILEPHSTVDQELAAYVLPALSEDYPPWERIDRFLEALNSLSLKSVMALADRFLADQLSASLAGVRLRVVPGFQIPHGASPEDQRSLMMSPSSRYRLHFSWHCPDLISAIYLQLFLLATKNTPMRFCEACQTPLPTKAKHKRFCNSTCRSNARNHR
jgi:hypothetical protein